MTITADQARSLLDTATDGPWGHYRHRGGYDTLDPVFSKTPGDEVALVHRTGDHALIAAAPDLARTVIDQAEEIEATRTALRFMYETYNTDIARLAAELPADAVVYDAETGQPDGEAVMNAVVCVLEQAREADQ